MELQDVGEAFTAGYSLSVEERSALEVQMAKKRVESGRWRAVPHSPPPPPLSNPRPRHLLLHLLLLLLQQQQPMLLRLQQVLLQPSSTRRGS